jgi:RNA polymerase sigma factor (sigma-70 family)
MNLPNLQNEVTSDVALWKAFRQGDRIAFEQIYRTHIRELYRYGIKIHSDEALVKDTIQNLFVELWNRRAALSSTKNIKYYLFKALRFKLYRTLKSEAYHGQQQKRHCDSEVVASYETQLIHFEFQQERRDKLYEALKQLPPRQKEVIHLLFTEELSYEQVAELMTINVASVYTLAWKALSSLKRLIITLLIFVCS